MDWGPAQVFAAAEEGEGGAHFGEAPQILDGRQLGGRVDDDGKAMFVGDGDCLAQGQAFRVAAAAREPEDAGGIVVDGGAQGGGRAVYFDALRAGLLDGEIVRVALAM